MYTCIFSVPLVQPIPYVVQLLKGRTGYTIFRQERFKFHLKQFYGGKEKHLWAVGYFCATIGAIDQETIKSYVERHQGKEDVEGIEVEL